MAAFPDVYRPFPWDWLIAIPMLLAGMAGVILVSDPILWDEVVHDSDSAKSIAAVDPLSGQVRFRSAQSSVWQDISERKAARTGDSVFTGPHGWAEVLMEDGNRIEMAPDTMIVIRLEKRVRKKDGDGWMRLASLIERKVETRNTPPDSIVEVKQGKVNVKAVKGLSPRKTTLVAGGKTYRVLPVEADSESSSAGENPVVSLSVAPSPIGGPKVGFAASDPTSIRIQGIPDKAVATLDPADRAHSDPAAAPLKTPLLISPGPDARFQTLPGGSAREISLRWDGVAAGASARVEIYHRGDATPVKVLEGGRFGTVLTLPPGEYSWWVRAVRGDEHSGWSENARFSVIEPLKHRNPPPAAKKPSAPPAVRTARASAHPAARPGKSDGTLPASKVKVPKRSARVSRTPARKKTEFKSSAQMTDFEREKRVQELMRKKAALYAQARKEIEAKKAGKEIEDGLLSVPRPGSAPLPPAPVTHRLASGVDRSIQPTRMPAAAIQLKTATVAAIRGTETRAEGGHQKSVRRLLVGGGDPSDVVAADTRIKDAENFSLDRLDVRLAWNSVQDAKGYEVAVFRGGIPFVTKKLDEPSYVMVMDSLQADYDYRVSAFMGDGSIVSSELTPIRIRVSPPSPKIPRDGDERELAAVLMTWERTVLTESYAIQISDSADFKSLILDRKEGGNFYYFTPPDTGTYYWRLRGYSGRSESDWSEVYRFTVK